MVDRQEEAGRQDGDQDGGDDDTERKWRDGDSGRHDSHVTTDDVSDGGGQEMFDDDDDEYNDNDDDVSDVNYDSFLFTGFCHQ